jgi:hypothetical protein
MVVFARLPVCQILLVIIMLRISFNTGECNHFFPTSRTMQLEPRNNDPVTYAKKLSARSRVGSYNNSLARPWARVSREGRSPGMHPGRARSRRAEECRCPPKIRPGSRCEHLAIGWRPARVCIFMQRRVRVSGKRARVDTVTSRLRNSLRFCPKKRSRSADRSRAGRRQTEWRSRSPHSGGSSDRRPRTDPATSRGCSLRHSLHRARGASNIPSHPSEQAHSICNGNQSERSARQRRHHARAAAAAAAHPRTGFRRPGSQSPSPDGQQQRQPGNVSRHYHIVLRAYYVMMRRTI